MNKSKKIHFCEAISAFPGKNILLFPHSQHLSRVLLSRLPGVITKHILAASLTMFQALGARVGGGKELTEFIFVFSLRLTFFLIWIKQTSTNVCLVELNFSALQTYWHRVQRLVMIGSRSGNKKQLHQKKWYYKNRLVTGKSREK